MEVLIELSAWKLLKQILRKSDYRLCNIMHLNCDGKLLLYYCPIITVLN